MAALTDPAVLAQFQAILSNWQYAGYVTATDAAERWLKKELGMPLRDLTKNMFQFLQNGGIIDQQVERRAEWNVWPFHYDFRIRFGNRHLYIESILQDDDPKDPTLHIVSIHDV